MPQARCVEHVQENRDSRLHRIIIIHFRLFRNPCPEYNVSQSCGCFVLLGGIGDVLMSGQHTVTLSPICFATMAVRLATTRQTNLDRGVDHPN